MFTFKGPVESSKSWMNRALVIQYYKPIINIDGFSKAEDVKHLQKAIQDLEHGQKVFDLGEGGTTFRFFSLLSSRIAGEWTLKANQRLLQRPQNDLLDIMKQLQVEIHTEPDQWKVHSKGWNIDKPIRCSAETSSQFISGLLLNSWNLPSDLQLEIPKLIVSEDYLIMTLKILEKAGLQIQKIETETLLKIIIQKNQIPAVSALKAEIDASSAFSLCAAAVVNGDVQITNWDAQSTQPDIAFLKIFKKMKILFSEQDKMFAVSKQLNWQSIDVNLGNEPDLFPVLAVLCALADGKSFLYGAKQLRSKESDRLVKTHELLSLCGFQTRLEQDGLVIQGRSSKGFQQKNIVFNPDQDHRMAMAAGVFKSAGFPLQILHPEVVQKSYPAFWHDIQVQP